jgi:hypothetical protein
LKNTTSTGLYTRLEFLVLVLVLEQVY